MHVSYFSGQPPPYSGPTGYPPQTMAQSYPPPQGDPAYPPPPQYGQVVSSANHNDPAYPPSNHNTANTGPVFQPANQYPPPNDAAYPPPPANIQY